jgi:TatD DNase family protein
MTDSHCHLTRLADPDAAVDGAGLAWIVTVGTSLEDSRAALELARRLRRVRVAVGVHPNEASYARDPRVRRGLAELAADPLVVAIGETGFDTHWREETLETQRAAFDWHAELAERTGKPLVLHVRDRQGADDASRAAAAAIREAGVRRGVLHCFNGHLGLMEAGLELGWHVSFAGNLTYRSSAALREAARAAPEDRLLVETDSPFLSPVPHRGEPNTPAHVRLTAAALAEARGADPAALEDALDANAAALFGWGAGVAGAGAAEGDGVPR